MRSDGEDLPGALWVVAKIADAAGLIFIAGLVLGGGWVVWHGQWQSLLVGVGLSVFGGFWWRIVALPSMAGVFGYCLIKNKSGLLAIGMLLGTVAFQILVTLGWAWLIYWYFVGSIVAWDRWGLILWGNFVATSAMMPEGSGEQGNLVSGLIKASMTQVTYWVLVVGNGILEIQQMTLLLWISLVFWTGLSLLATKSLRCSPGGV